MDHHNSIRVFREIIQNSDPVNDKKPGYKEIHAITQFLNKILKAAKSSGNKPSLKSKCFHFLIAVVDLIIIIP